MYISCGLALAWFDSPALVAVLAMAMIISMTIAGLAGTTISIFLTATVLITQLLQAFLLRRLQMWSGFRLFRPRHTGVTLMF